MVIDPICCLTVDESTERRARFNGETVYFCSEHCRDTFLAATDAEKYKITHQRAGAHTCARHPELWQENPCDCPKCRMALEPTGKPAETDGRVEAGPHDLTDRFRIANALVLSVKRWWRGIATGPVKPPVRYILKS